MSKSSDVGVLRIINVICLTIVLVLGGSVDGNGRLFGMNAFFSWVLGLLSLVIAFYVAIKLALKSKAVWRVCCIILLLIYAALTITMIPYLVSVL